MPLASAYRPSFTTRQLLVSVQNACEAETAFRAGVAWVDLKNPSAGSLGQPSQQECESFVIVASQYPGSRISLALGELDQVDWERVSRWLPAFAVGKIGLTGQRKMDAELVEQLLKFDGKIVPALYADWQRAQAASPDEVLQFARAIKAPYLLVDTCIKDGQGLFDWLSLETLQALQAQSQSFGAELVVAGSLRTTDWTMLAALDNITVGVRGAVCETNSDRSSQLCPAAIEQWLSWSRS